MRVGVLSDIHANWEALEAVLNDMGEVDEVVCLGDIVGYGGDPARCLDAAATRGWLTLVGNHDRACIEPGLLDWFNGAAAYSIRWTLDQLGQARLDWLRLLPARTESHDIVLVHASPRDPTYEYVLDFLTASANLSELGDSVCFHGHTHVPGAFFLEAGEVVHDYDPRGKVALAGPRLVNPGSVGQPRDGNPNASYGVWDVDSATFEFRRVDYDREAAKQAIRAAGLPAQFAERLDVGR